MNRYYLVTGGTNGIGLSVVGLLANNKDNVVFSISRSDEGIQSARLSTRRLPAPIHFLKGDISSEAGILECVNRIAETTDTLDGLVNNAGVILPGGVETLSVANWRATMDVNLTSVFMTIQQCLPLLRKSHSPSIVNISSISSIVTGPSVAYSVCKAAVDMLTKGAARELGKYHIRVNSVNPGFTKTGFHVRNGLMNAGQYQKLLKDVAAKYPLGLGRPEDVAKVVLFLLSDESRWMTGSIVIVDGGRIINS